MKKFLKYFLAFSLLILGFNVNAQSEKSIEFMNVAFTEVQALAKKSEKLIFIDCYTSWCLPCKKMDKEVFVIDSIYNFYNSNFINMKLDMEKGEGIDLQKIYEVSVFPTYLFLNSSGEIVHRTAGLMSVENFLKEGTKALNPDDTYSALKSKYEAGDPSNDVLFKYGDALRFINRDLSEKVNLELATKITDEELKTKFGWKVIEQISQSESDRLGSFMISNIAYYKKLVGEDSVDILVNRLRIRDMYKLIREKKGDLFLAKIDDMRKDENPKTKRNVIMLLIEFYLNENNAVAFVNETSLAMKGIFEFNDADIGFIARRAAYMQPDNAKIMNEALIMARRAVAINPEEYSNQSTLGNICLQLKLKEEGLVAAKKSLVIAKGLTSKIEKIAQKLVDDLETL